jgi:cytochrome c oxidase subunit 3
MSNRSIKDESRGRYVNILISRRKISPCFIPACSPWPFVNAQAIFCLLISTVMWFHYFINSVFCLLVSLFVLCLVASFWFKDLIIEAQYIGAYTLQTSKNLRLGFVLFLISEVMFFFSLFWAYFHFSLTPSIWIGAVWPPYGMETISPFGLPLLNTIILVTSGFTLTYVQKVIIENGTLARLRAIRGFLVTLLLAVYFILVQYYEFVHAPFSINDSVYGSIFFFITGFHGLHVIVGTIFLFVMFLRVIGHHFYVENTLALDCAA